MGFFKNGKTEDNAELLSLDSFPTYMRFGQTYQVLSSKHNGIDRKTGTEVFVYCFAEFPNGSARRFIASPYILPERFWVRGVHPNDDDELYQILPDSDKGMLNAEFLPKNQAGRVAA